MLLASYTPVIHTESWIQDKPRNSDMYITYYHAVIDL